MKKITGETFDEERALYGSHGIEVTGCRFDGPADGESALKESSDIFVKDCFFNLRYPFWHDDGLHIEDSELTQLCRAALWYSRDIDIVNTKMHGIKALRECARARLVGCDIISPEFGWSVDGIEMKDSKAESEYFLMRSRNIHFTDVEFKGKYSFQYIEDAEFDHCTFDTKDAFWHGKNIVVRNSVIRGEYLAWYSDNLTLIDCKIMGTQPFCYCSNLKLVNCELTEADLCFEKSWVDAEITTPVISIKNPAGGRIVVPSVEEIIMDDDKAQGEIVQAGR